MKDALKVFSFIGVILGMLAMMGSLFDADFYALVGGGLFFTQGLLALLYINQQEGK